jgi:hypothetical protein
MSSAMLKAYVTFRACLNPIADTQITSITVVLNVAKRVEVTKPTAQGGAIPSQQTAKGV